MKRSLLLRRLLLVAGALLVASCAAYRGSELKPGVATLPEVLATMGEPAMRWKDNDGREQLAYPRGPAGTQTFMAWIAADGRLERIEPVFDAAHFARIETGKSDQAAVLRVLGPSPSQWTQFYQRSNQLAWSWLFCDSWNSQAFFDVMFDATTGIVQSTGQRQNLMGWDGRAPGCSQ